jgi:hypothetical protein
VLLHVAVDVTSAAGAHAILAHAPLASSHARVHLAPDMAAAAGVPAAEHILARLHTPVWLYSPVRQVVVYANAAAARLAADAGMSTDAWTTMLQGWPLPPQYASPTHLLTRTRMHSN